MNVFSVCSGIGALDLGLQRAGMRIVAQVEKDPYCMRVLDYHFPEAAKHDDVHTAVDWWVGSDRPRVDVVAGGPPCQPVSLAGVGDGAEDERWLWDQFLAIVDHLRPEWVVWENVPGLLTRGMDIVHGAFTELGYNHTVGVTSACAVGAPHVRRRLLGVAHAPRFHWAREPGVVRLVDGPPDELAQRAVGNAVVPQLGEYIGHLIISAGREVMA